MAPITHVAFSPDARRLASSSYDGSVLLWALEAQGPRPTGRIRHRRLVNSASWSPQVPGLLATAAADKTVGVWQVDDEGRPEMISSLARHTDDVNAVAWLPDGERVVTASEDSTALLWEFRTGRYLGQVTSHSGHCMAIAVAPDGRVLTVGEDGAVFVTDVDAHSAPHSRVFDSSIEGCAWSPDGSRAALACDDGTVRIVSPELDLLDEIECASSAVRSVAFARDGSDRLVVGSYDAGVRVLDGRDVQSSVFGGRLWPRSLDTAGDLVAVGSFASEPVLLTLDGLTQVHDGGADTYGPNALATNGDTIAVGLDSGHLITVPRSSLAEGTPEGATAVRVAAEPLLSLSATPDGWVAGTYAGEVRRVTTTGGTAQVGTAVQLGSPVPSLATTPDGSAALAGTYAGKIATLGLQDGLEVLDVQPGHDGSIKSIAWLSATEAVTGGTDCAVRVRPGDGPARDLWWHGNLVNAVATNGEVVASASRDRMVYVGPADGSSPRFALQGPSESVKAVGVLGSGERTWVLAGAYDFGLYAWHVVPGGAPPNARAGVALHAFDQAVSTMIAVDATTALVASWDGTLRMVTVGRDELVVGPEVPVQALVAEAEFAARAGRSEVAGVGA